jgi:hypothetical protein
MSADRKQAQGEKRKEFLDWLALKVTFFTFVRYNPRESNLSFVSIHQVRVNY